MFLHNIMHLCGLDNEGAPNAPIVQNPVQSPSELMASINFIKAEIQKVSSGGKSSIADVHALGAEAVPDAIVLCNYAINILSGNSIDDRRLEMEKVIKMLSTLPSNSQFGALLNKIFLYSLWKQLPHPSTSFPHQAGYQWRSADGSGNNISFPEVGKAGQKYIQDFVSKRPQATDLPDPGVIFQELLERRPGGFKANQSNISSNLFYFATLITHDLFNTRPTDRSVNETTSYLDLSPLYGWSKDMQASVRTGTNGLLKPDHFADERIWFQPAGLTALVVLFSRNHNYLAEKLLQTNENDRFKSLPDKDRDEALFQTARLINERTYVNIILHDYLRVILGVNRVESLWTLDVLQDYSSVKALGELPSATGNQCSLEFNFIYRWHHATSVDDEKWIEGEFSRMFGDWKNTDAKTMFQKLHNLEDGQKHNSQLNRHKDGRFEDKDLAKALINGCKNVSGAFGGQNTPTAFRNIEITGILHARAMGVCTLNEYRDYLKLRKYQSFSELNPHLADRLAKLYKTVDDVELYPGLLCEQQKPAIPGSGLCANYTTSFAILSDAVALVRGDRFYSKHGTYFNLTNFGMEDSQPNNAVNYGTLLGSKLISRHLSSVYKQNSVYAAFPFTLPSETSANLGKNQKDYDFTSPL